MKRFIIVYFELDNGKCPVEDFIHSLEPKMKAKVFMEMALLEELGNQLPFPYSSYLEKTNKTAVSEKALAKKYKRIYERRAHEDL